MSTRFHFSQKRTEPERQAIFRSLVYLEDLGMSFKESRDTICAEYYMTFNTLRAIEREGIGKCWPPMPPRVGERKAS